MKGKDGINILYVGHIMIGDDSATGKTLWNIYSKCNNLRIMQYCLDYDMSYHETEYNTVYISPNRSIVFFAIKSLYRKFLGEKSGREKSVSFASHKKSKLSTFAKALLDVLPKRESRRDSQRIEEFAPDVILCLAENISTLRTAIRFSDEFNIPIVAHIMDDIEESIYDSRFTRFFQNKYKLLLEQMYYKSVINLAISPIMAKEYSKRHKKRFLYAMNCVTKVYRQRQERHFPLKMIFSGGLHGGRADSLQQIGLMIKNNLSLDRNIRLVVYTSKGDYEKYISTLGHVCEFNEYVPAEMMFENLLSADILLHCESFSIEEINYFRYSMSTKIPEYLSVGRPILCYGPSEICSVSYIDSKHVGIVAETPDELVSALEMLTEDDSLRLEMGKRALQVAQEEHLQSKVAERVESLYMSVLEEWRRSAAKC